MAESSLAAKCTAEFLGTFLLIFTVGCNVLSGNAVWGGVSIGSVLMVAIYALGGISGANFNPAVSLALGVTKAMNRNGGGMEWKDVCIYVAVQLLAGVVAAFSYAGIFMESFTLGPSQGFSFWQAGVCELLYTFMLCFVILNVAVASKNQGNEFYGLAIGYVIVAGAYGAGAVSGGCFNPAVAIGIDASSLFKGGGWSALYVLCELCGAVLAALAFRVVRPEDFGGEERSEASQLVSEFLGTFFLVLTVGLNVLGESPAGAFSIAASLMCMIYALGNVSGAHFNPAVTVAVLASRRNAELTVVMALKFVLSQLVGGLLGACTYMLIRNGESFPLAPGEKFGWGEVAVAEIIYTCLLCYVVLCVAVSTTTGSKTMFGLAIGSCVTVGGNAIGAISGGSLNPAVSFGIATSHLCAGGRIGGILAALAYTLFEVMGGVLAAGIFGITHAVDLAREEDEGGAEKHLA